MKRNECPKCESKRHSQAVEYSWNYEKPFVSYCSKCKIKFDEKGDIINE